MDKILKLSIILGILIISFSVLWNFVIYPYQKDTQYKENYKYCFKKHVEVCEDGKCSWISVSERDWLIDSCIKNL